MQQLGNAQLLDIGDQLALLIHFAHVGAYLGHSEAGCLAAVAAARLCHLRVDERARNGQVQVLQSVLGFGIAPDVVELLNGVGGVFVAPLLGEVVLHELVQRLALVAQGPAEEVCAAAVVLSPICRGERGQVLGAGHADEQAQIHRLHQVAVVLVVCVVQASVAGVGRYAFLDFGHECLFKGGEILALQQRVYQGIKLAPGLGIQGAGAMQGQGGIIGRSVLLRGGVVFLIRFRGGGWLFVVGFLLAGVAEPFSLLLCLAAGFFLGGQAFSLGFFCGEALLFCLFGGQSGLFLSGFAFFSGYSGEAGGLLCLAFLFLLLPGIVAIITTATQGNEN